MTAGWTCPQRPQSRSTCALLAGPPPMRCPPGNRCASHLQPHLTIAADPPHVIPPCRADGAAQRGRRHHRRRPPGAASTVTRHRHRRRHQGLPTSAHLPWHRPQNRPLRRRHLALHRSLPPPPCHHSRRCDRFGRGSPEVSPTLLACFPPTVPLWADLHRRSKPTSRV